MNLVGNMDVSFQRRGLHPAWCVSADIDTDSIAGSIRSGVKRRRIQLPGNAGKLCRDDEPGPALMLWLALSSRRVHSMHGGLFFKN